MFLGVDLGSSSIKLSLFDPRKSAVLASVTHPKQEMNISAPQNGWAEQEPEDWWSNFLEAYQQLMRKPDVNPKSIEAIGISYQMHGLVVVDKNKKVLRPSIIWCDSRAVSIGDEAYHQLGKTAILPSLLNAPGNFTASKLGWVKKYEPELFAQIYKVMLPGDFMAMKLSGEITTTAIGLSEGIFWDFKSRSVNEQVLDVFGFDTSILPEIVPAIGATITVEHNVAELLGLSDNVRISYRAGDQSNNAFSLNVLNPGEIAATAGTSGVIYAVTDKNVYDKKSRINTFLHVNDTNERLRNGVLICINGTGILYSWLRKLLQTGSGVIDYEHMNALMDSVAPGSDGIHCLPFGNGAERIFENKIVGAHFLHMDFNRHENKHFIRAAVEGIVYALNLGFTMLADLDIPLTTIRAGKANLFLSKTFREIFVNVTGTPLELYDTDGASGAARGAALGIGFYASEKDAFSTLDLLEEVQPDPETMHQYQQLFDEWRQSLSNHAFI